MQKVGIVTFHQSNSYGACLQAYATYLKFHYLGYDTEFVNYENPYEAASNRLVWSKNLKQNIKLLAKKFIFQQSKHQKKSFSEFHQMMPKSKVYTKNDLKNAKYDILVSGSDQIWNPTICNELDLTYFLDFNHEAKKISYATSAGSHVFSNEEKSKIESCLLEYQYISVRENFLKEQIQSMVHQKVKLLLDPTLLISHEDWLRELKNKSIRSFWGDRGKYILCFIVAAKTDEYYDLIRKVSVDLNLPVWFISPDSFKRKGIDRVLTDVTPFEFLDLIENAGLVLTNSFHGVAFSVNFEKKFVALKNYHNPVRVEQFLDQLNLKNRIVTEIQQLENFEYAINYYAVTQILNGKRDDCNEWIENVVK